MNFSFCHSAFTLKARDLSFYSQSYDAHELILASERRRDTSSKSPVHKLWEAWSDGPTKGTYLNSLLKSVISGARNLSFLCVFVSSGANGVEIPGSCHPEGISVVLHCLPEQDRPVQNV